MRCPRRAEAPHISDAFPRETDANGLYCDYCGSLLPDVFFQHIEQNCKLGPTDKNYKVYIQIPNPRRNMERIVSKSTHETPGYRQATKADVVLGQKSGWTVKLGDYIQTGPESEYIHAKFYFQHLDEVEQIKFVNLLNEKKLNIDMPGYFYVLPFFVRKP